MGDIKECPICGCMDIRVKHQYRRVFYECAKCKCCGYSAHTKLGARMNWNNEEYRERTRYNHGKSGRKV